MRTPIQIDFGRSCRYHSPIALAVMIAGIGLLGAALFDYHNAAVNVESLAKELKQTQVTQENSADSKATLPTLKLSPQGIVAINRAVTQLNLPWSELFSIVEANALPSIALLTLEPESQKQLLRITAEAKVPEDMLSFFELLQAEPNFTEVVLTKHEINEQDPNRPIRFSLEAYWRTAE